MYRIKITERGLGFFVSRTATDGLRDGSSWKNAFATIGEALAVATSGDRIWVAAGVYSPDGAGGFEIRRDSIEIYGGFSGEEEYLYERNPSVNLTVMRGDGLHSTVTADRCAGIRIDGFTIENGHSTNGAGIAFTGGATGTLANSIIKGNIATGYGGGVYASAPWYGYGGLTLINVEISGNQASTGAGIYNESSKMKILNARVSGNRGIQAGGLYSGGGNPQIYNSIIRGNVATHGNGSNTDVYNANGMPEYTNSLIGGSNGSGDNWTAALGVAGGGNRDMNPVFLYSGTENDGTTLHRGNYHLSGISGCPNRKRR